MTVEILRTYLPTETLGSLIIDGVCQAKTMELPDKDNAHNVSCIPEGTYWCIREESSPNHEYPHFRVLGVPNRGNILWHKITYVKDLRGCIGIVGDFKDLNADGVPDSINSGITLTKLYNKLPDKFQFTIKKK
jgi:hypothetical protein